MKRTDEITVTATVNSDVDNVWRAWTTPEEIKEWNNASPDWDTPKVENDLREGGKFNWRMEAKDGSMGFDFAGTYKDVKQNELIAYTLDDGRKVAIAFEKVKNGIKI